MLVGVVGPSGAGKDTLMDGARAALAGDVRFVFARRVITRPAEAGGEDHLPATAADFARMREQGDFALWWNAHGLSYGIPARIAAEVGQGRVVVANLSRGVLAEAAALPGSGGARHPPRFPARARQGARRGARAAR